MIHLDNLTGGWKIMNMQKAGIVSRAHNFEKSAVMRCNAYTLCEVRFQKLGGGYNINIYYIQGIKKLS